MKKIHDISVTPKQMLEHYYVIENLMLVRVMYRVYFTISVSGKHMISLKQMLQHLSDFHDCITMVVHIFCCFILMLSQLQCFQ